MAQDWNGIKDLDEQTTHAFLKKYDKIIYYEAHKRETLPGISQDDLIQECRIKLLSNLNSFDKEKSSEKTWVQTIIKRKLNSIRTEALRQKRVDHIKGRDGNMYPVHDFVFTENLKLANYEPSTDEHFNLLETLKYLKGKLPKESYEIVEREFIPNLDQFIVPTKSDYKLKDKESFKVYTKFSGLPENEIKLLSQIAKFFVDFLGFKRKQILGRTKTVDISL